MLDIHLQILKLTVKELKSLNNEIVYVGGSTISLYVTEPRFVKIRETLDVDCIVQVAHREEYEVFSKKLRAIGFSEDSESKVMCRFKKGDLILDAMPTDEKILGFSNPWYREGFDQSIKYELNNHKINVFDLPYILATKIEAFKGRGKGSYLMSHDVEDIVTIFDGRPSIAADLKKSEKKVLAFLKGELTHFLNDSKFISSLDAHISDKEITQGRKKIIIQRISDFINE